MSEEQTAPEGAENQPPAGQSAEQQVLAELGAAAGDDNPAAGENEGAVEAAGESEGDGEPTAAQKRAQKAAATRKRNREAAKAAEDAKAKEESDLGVASATVVDADLSEIPRDEDGNPLWYFNEKTRRVIPANATLNRPDIRKRMRLKPCMPPVVEDAE